MSFSFSEEKQFAYYHDIPSLHWELGVLSYSLTHCRLFLDSSKRSLKCLLLYNGNVYRAVPVSQSIRFAKRTQ